MKYYTLLLFTTVVFNCHGQDTASHLSKHSISFTSGANISYPTSTVIPYGYFGAKPINGFGPWCSLEYDYSLSHTKHFSTGVKLGIGYAQYKYMVEPGNEITYDRPILLQQANEGEIFTGVFCSFNFLKRMGWYNEFDISWSGKINSTTSLEDDWQNPIYLSYLPYGDFSNLFLMYRTGIAFYITKDFTVIPLVGIPLVNLTELYDPTVIYVVNAYRSLRTGITITYNFSKKAHH